MAYVLFLSGLMLTMWAGRMWYRQAAEETVANLNSSPDIVMEADDYEKNTKDGHNEDWEEIRQRIESQKEEIEKQKHLLEQMKKQPCALAEPENTREKRKEQDRKKLHRARLYNDVYLLHDQGVSLSKIARQIGRGKGEVQLILGLRGSSGQ